MTVSPFAPLEHPGGGRDRNRDRRSSDTRGVWRGPGVAPEQVYTRARATHGRGEGRDVVRAVMAPAVDEEAGRAGDAAGVGAGHVLRDAVGVHLPDHRLAEALEIEPQLLRVASEVIGSQLGLVRDEPLVHSPERALGTRRLRRLRRRLGMRVDVAQREMAPDVAKVFAEGLEQLPDDELGPATVRTLVVPVLDERDG